MSQACATRGCTNPLPPGRWTMCVSCLTGGGPRFARLRAQAAAVEAMPPMIIPSGCLGFRMPGRPLSVNRAYRRGAGKRLYMSDEGREWKRAVSLYAARARPPGWLMDARYQLELLCVFDRSSSDADGPVKLVQDALQGIAYDNDRQVLGVSSSKLVDSSLARLEVMVRIA